MKRIKLLLYILAIIVVPGYFMPSCDKFFEQPDSTTMNEDSVFVRYDNAKRLVYQMYAWVPNIIENSWMFRLDGPCAEVLTDGASAYTGQSRYGSHKFINGAINATNVMREGGANGVEYRYTWGDVRVAYTLINRIHEVPDMSYEEKERVVAESKTMIAFRYFEMFKRVGGIPLVKGKLDDVSEFSIPRSSLQETYDYIIQLLDEAIASPHYPARVPSTLEFGRLTKAYAYALKARVMLYAASPLFNTGSPYINFGENNPLICFGSYDKERWKAAADAAQAAIDYCLGNGYAIVDNQASYVNNYITATQYTPESGNTEVIWAKRVKIDDPRGFLMRGDKLNGTARNIPTHNQVEKYRNADGSYMDWSTTIVTPANDPTYPYRNLEPRFQASIAYNGQEWYKDYILELYDGEDGVANGKHGVTTAKSEYNYGLHKYLHGYEDIQITGVEFWFSVPYMRLSEMYMIYAEAMNEYSGVSAGVTDALNKVLNRAGMSVPAITDQTEMRNFIRRERAVEFYYEEHRFFDVKRWLTGEVLGGEIFNMEILKSKSGTFRYTKKVFENRIWNNHYYLWPFPQDEINKNYGLIQNPGW